MMKVLTPGEARRLDGIYADRLPELMERAGHAVAMEVLRAGYTYGSRILLLAGPGNNGGDAYIAARHLRGFGADARVVALGVPRTDLASAAARAATDAGVPIEPWCEPRPADVLVDGLFGVGFSGALAPEALAWIDHAGFTVAIDMPSGVDGTTGTVANGAFTADVTVTFHSPKVGHLVANGPEHTGALRVVDIGMEGGEAELLWWTGEDSTVPGRHRNSHKWSAGSVLVVGGSPGMVGAPLLAAVGALRSGAGAVAVVRPGGLALQAPPALLSRALGSGERFSAGDAQAVLEAGARYDVLALGPGLGEGQERFVNQLVEAWQGSLVLDADGINALDLAVLEGRTYPTVITPHQGEFLRLTGETPSYAAAGELAAGTGSVVLLKGSPSFVANTGVTKVITSGGPELATIGTGDVLTGMVAAFLARGLQPSNAAASAAYWHGVAGRKLADRAIVTANSLAEEIAFVVPQT